MTHPEGGERGLLGKVVQRPGSASVLLFAGLAVVYLLLLQKQPYGDGITYLDYLVDGKLAFHHLLYLPTLWVFGQLGSLFGIPLRTMAFAWSAVASAGAVSILFYLSRTARTFRFEIGRPWLLALLLATAPSVIFYATQLENHANHLLWVSLFFLALDRALASLSPLPWVLAGLTLCGAYASHSSILLLFPALLVLVHGLWSGRYRRLPEAPEVLRLLLLFVPTLVFKYVLEPWIKGLQGDPNLAGDFGKEFALKLIEARSASWLSSYFLEEVLFAAFGLWVLFALFQCSRQERRIAAGSVLFGLLTYYLFFAHWPVREKGAYFLPLLPFVALSLGSPPPWFRRGATWFLMLLILAQAVLGYRAMREHDRLPGPWKTADSITAVVPPGTVILCRDGVVQLHLRHDHDLVAHALENWMIGWKHSAGLIPDFWNQLIQVEILPKLDHSLAQRPLYLTRAGSEVLESDPGAAKILDALREHYRFEPLGEGRSAGWRLYPRP